MLIRVRLFLILLDKNLMTFLQGTSKQQAHSSHLSSLLPFSVFQDGVQGILLPGHFTGCSPILREREEQRQTLSRPRQGIIMQSYSHPTHSRSHHPINLTQLGLAKLLLPYTWPDLKIVTCYQDLSITCLTGPQKQQVEP